MLSVNVDFKKLRQDAKLPEQGSKWAAGYDLFACIDQDVIIHPGEVGKIGTGLAAAPPVTTWLGIFARSGLSTKRGLRLANNVGKIKNFFIDFIGQI